jgi:signal transduction histidine kinase/DNA-binding NarL/FixJ family response regulator
VKILAVDDNEQIRELLAEMLARFGFACSTAANGREALDLMHKEDFSLVLTDMRMPEMGGIELLREIKKNYPDTDVISVTGYDANYTFTDVIKAGASDFILKPFAEDEVEAKINRVFRERQLKADILSTNESLRELKDYLENIIRSSLDCIVVSDSRGCIMRVNKSFVDLVGVAEEEVIGSHIYTFSPTERGTYESLAGEEVAIDETFLHDAQEHIAQLTSTGRISNWETYLIRSDKKIVPVEENIDFLYNSRGEHIGAVGIIREITERKKALGEKSRIEDTLKNKVTELSIMNEISEVLLSTRELDEILHMILIGATAYQALGFNRAFLFLVNEEVTMLEGEIATGTLTIEEGYQIWERLSLERLTLKALLQSRHGELSQEDEPINNLVKQIKIPLKETESIFTHAVYEGKSFNIVEGAQNPLIDRNLMELLGTDSFALVPLASRGKPLGILLADNFINKQPINDEDVEQLRAFANHASLAIENSHLYKSLREKVEELSSAYNELQVNRDKLIRYERLSAVGEVAAKVTHEIRNPMVAIGGFARRILKKDSDGELNRNYLKIIVEEIGHLENILTDILYFAKPAMPICSNVDLNGIVSGIIEMLEVEMEEHTICIERHLDAEMPLLSLDENQIRRVLINVMRNAMQAMPEGGTITVSTVYENQWVTVEIADTGIGISDDDIDKLFDAFFSSKSTGSGLGLTVSAQIINNHGGTIEVKRREPKGTVFIIKIPSVCPESATQ